MCLCAVFFPEKVNNTKSLKTYCGTTPWKDIGNVGWQLSMGDKQPYSTQEVIGVLRGEDISMMNTR